MSRFSSAIHSAGRSPVAAANRIIGPYRPPSAATASSSLANPPRCTRLEPRPPTRYRYAQSGACSRPGRLSSNTWPCWIIAILLDRQPTEECHRVAAATTSLIEGWSFGSESTLWPSEFSRRLGACDGCEPRRSGFLGFQRARVATGGATGATADEIGAVVRSNRTTTNPARKGPARMKLTTITHVSVDGVMQGLGGSDEDRRGGFERGGWALPLFDGEAATFLDQVFQRADVFFNQRPAYEIFAGSWGTGSWGANQGNNPISVALNHTAQVRGIDHAHRPAVGGHDSP